MSSFTETLYNVSTQTLETVYPSSEDFVSAFTGNVIDDTTLAALWNSFYWRSICDTPDNFAAYLKSLFWKVGQQYEDLLRVQLTRIDPIVTRYLEREVTHTGTDATEATGKTTRGGSDSTTRTGSVTHGGSDKTEKSGSDSTKYGHTIETSGTDNRTTKTNQTRTESASTTTAARETTTSGTSSGTGASDSRGLSASLPQVDSYSASGFPAGATVGTSGGGTSTGVLAQAMDWRNADSQTETAGTTETSGSTSGTSRTEVEAPDTSTTTTTYSGNGDTDDLTRDMTDTHGGTDTRTTSETATTTYGATESTEDGSTTTYGGTEDTAGNTTVTHDTTERERYTGHDGNPADLLKAAREYIQGTGAFSWLCRRVDTCFIDVYDF